MGVIEIDAASIIPGVVVYDTKYKHMDFSVIRCYQTRVGVISVLFFLYSRCREYPLSHVIWIMISDTLLSACCRYQLTVETPHIRFKRTSRWYPTISPSAFQVKSNIKACQAQSNKIKAFQAQSNKIKAFQAQSNTIKGLQAKSNNTTGLQA